MACGMPLSKGQRIWSLLCWKTRPWCQNLRGLIGGGGGGCNELKTAQSISRAREAYWNDTWRKSSNSCRVFFKVNIFIPIKTECCCPFLLTFQTSCPVCPPGARIDAVVRTSKSRASLGLLPPRAREVWSAISGLECLSGIVIHFFAKDVLLIPSTKRWSHTEGISDCFHVCAPWHALMPLPDHLLQVTFGLPAEVNHVAAVNQDVALVVVCSQKWFVKRMWLTRWIGYLSPLIQHSKRQVGIGLLGPSNASSETVVNAPVGTPQNIGGSTNISFCSWKIHLSQKRSETFKKLMFWAQRSAWDTFG